MEVEVYSDGTFDDRLGLGAWCFRIPVLNAEGAGIAPGKNSGVFEVLGTLNGVEAALASSPLEAQIQAWTDCDEVVDFVKMILRGNLKYGPDKAVLIPRLQQVLQTGRVRIERLRRAHSEHRLCHHGAARRLKQEIERNQVLRCRSALAEERTHLQTLVRERRQLEDQLLNLNVDIGVRQVQVDALEHALLLAEENAKGDLSGPDHAIHESTI